jgi:hypothetical protein
MIRKYNAPRGVYILMKQYIIFKKVDPSQIPAPLAVISERDKYVGPDYEMPLDLYLKYFPNDHVYLDITGEVQQQDLIDFIKLNWGLIKSKLKLIERQRPSAVKGKQRDVIHAEVLRLREEDRKSYRQIAVLKGLTESNIKQILYRERKHRKVDNQKLK